MNLRMFLSKYVGIIYQLNRNSLSLPGRVFRYPLLQFRYKYLKYLQAFTLQSSTVHIFINRLNSMNIVCTSSRAIAFQSHVGCLTQVLNFTRMNFRDKNDSKQCTIFNPDITRKIINNHLSLMSLLHVATSSKSSPRRYIQKHKRTANPVKDVSVYN
jgi:hypothetical protein